MVEGLTAYTYFLSCWESSRSERVMPVCGAKPWRTLRWAAVIIICRVCVRYICDYIRLCVCVCVIDVITYVCVCVFEFVRAHKCVCICIRMRSSKKKKLTQLFLFFILKTTTTWFLVLFVTEQCLKVKMCSHECHHFVPSGLHQWYHKQGWMESVANVLIVTTKPTFFCSLAKSTPAWLWLRELKI